MRFAKIPDDVNPVMPGGFVKERYTILIDIYVYPAGSEENDRNNFIFIIKFASTKYASKVRLQKYQILH